MLVPPRNMLESQNRAYMAAKHSSLAKLLVPHMQNNIQNITANVAVKYIIYTQ